MREDFEKKKIMKRKKEKSLLPSLREKKKYLLIEKTSKDRIEKAVLDYVGVLGYGKAAPMWVKGKENILAVNRKELEKVKAALELDGIKVRRVSGTLKSFEEKKK